MATATTEVSIGIVATEKAPRFEIDPTWPKPLPEGWINGQLPACVSTATTTSSAPAVATSPGVAQRAEELEFLKAIGIVK